MYGYLGGGPFREVKELLQKSRNTGDDAMPSAAALLQRMPNPKKLYCYVLLMYFNLQRNELNPTCN
jgi:hypothetical protein